MSLYFSVAVDHEFYAALDTLVVSVAMVLLIVFDFYHPANYFIDELESNNIKNKTY